MIKIKLLSLFTLIALIFVACNKEEDTPTPVSISANNFEITIDENPADAATIGTVSATASDNGTLTYSLSNQNVAGAIAINANTGELTVADASAFDFETNSSITASYAASNGTEEAAATITITLNDVNEIGNGTEFAMTFETSSANQNITIPVLASTYTYNFNVDWGDGAVSTNQSATTGHNYTNPGTYQVLISGDFPAVIFGSGTSGTRAALQSIDQWGTIEWQSMNSAFANCENMNITATDAPDLSNVTDMSSMFGSSSSFNSDISHWDVSNVSSMQGLFSGASSFNQPLDAWDVSNVTNMINMFNEASVFNQDLNNWDVGKVTDMLQMFRSASAFNGNVSNWDVSSVTRMSSLFINSSFAGDISNWDVSNVTAMGQMFWGLIDFNSDISGWDVSKVTAMDAMFSGARSFDQDISGWDVSSATTMRQMFQSANSFNRDISSWDVSNVTNMSRMFRFNTGFNQNLSGWNVANVTNCSDFAATSSLIVANRPNFTNCTP